MIGTGIAKRDFVFASDIGKVILELLSKPSSNRAINVSSGEFHSIKDVVELVTQKYKYQGKVLWGDKKDDGVLFKGLDNSYLKTKIDNFEFTSFKDGISITLDSFKQFQL